MLRAHLSRPLRARGFSVLSSFQFTKEDSGITRFPGSRGVDLDLNASLAADGVTTRGDTYRNASVRDLFEFSERSTVRITGERALELVGGPMAKAIKTGAFATDALPGTKAMDVDEFEGRLASVRDDCLSFAPQLFVEDAALGGSRGSEIRVRVITDSPLVALFLRALLHTTPLYNPQVFPRTLTLYASTLTREGSGAAGRGMSAPFTVVDADTGRGKGTIVACGPVALASLASALATAGGALGAGAAGSPQSYRNTPFVPHPALGEARAAGVLPWYLRDGHWYAGGGEAHPTLLPLRGAAVVMGGASSGGGGGGGGSVVVLGNGGSGALEGGALKAGRLFAAGGAIIEGGGMGGVGGGGPQASGTFSGLALPSPMAGTPMKGALIAQGATTVPLCTPSRLAPGGVSKVVVYGGGAGASGLDAVAPFVEGLSGEAAKARVQALLGKGVEVVVVGSEAEAAKAAGL